MHSRSADNLTAHPEAAGIIRQASGTQVPGPLGADKASSPPEKRSALAGKLAADHPDAIHGGLQRQPSVRVLSGALSWPWTRRSPLHCAPATWII